MENVILLFLIVTAVLLAGVLAALIVILRRKPPDISDPLQDGLDRLESRINFRIGEFEIRNTSAQNEADHMLRTEVRETLSSLGSNVDRQLANFSTRFDGLSKVNEERSDALRKTLSDSIETIRTAVDEKLSATLEQRLGASFRLVSERLEAVQRGLGEMQSLATGVGDLRRVFGNVKERGTWGEYQLGVILEDILAPQQYEKNVAVTPGRERVEYAVKLPGRTPDQACIWLPIDSKFPKESYERLVDAARTADVSGVDSAATELKRAVLKMAKDIQDKYIQPPSSTDFAILFLPTEGLYAEVLKQPGLHDTMQQKHHVIVAGPTTLSAILNSLRVGFQTLAIEKRAGEVWRVLAEVKAEFGRFSETIDKVRRQITTVSNTLDESSVRTRVMERKLRSVETFPEAEVAEISDE